MLKRRKGSKGETEINVGSFADIAFLLIIFFILTTQLIKPLGKRMELPAGTEDKTQQTDQQLTINIRKIGEEQVEIRYGEASDVVSFDELRESLESENFPGKKEDKDKIVILDSKDDVPYGAYFRIVMAINKAGGVLALLETEGKAGKGGGQKATAVEKKPAEASK